MFPGRLASPCCDLTGSMSVPTTCACTCLRLASRVQNNEPRLFLQVVQTFACENYPEIGKRYLRADLGVECDTATHEAFKVYAAIMICICESVGLWYGRHRFRLPANSRRVTCLVNAVWGRGVHCGSTRSAHPVYPYFLVFCGELK